MPPIRARRDDPFLETVARSIHTLFPRCVRCGAIIERLEDADVRILASRLVHRGACPPTGAPPARPVRDD